VSRFGTKSVRAPKLRANQRILKALEEALSYAEMKNCSVDDVHKDAMRLYLQTWVMGPLKSAILDMKGIGKSRW
jgi:hypothetical protein